MEAHLRRHGFAARRGRGVRSPTLMAKLPVDFPSAVLWSQYNALVPILHEQVDHCIQQILDDLPPVGQAVPQQFPTPAHAH
jgi:hypothetical protein